MSKTYKILLLIVTGISNGNAMDNFIKCQFDDDCISCINNHHDFSPYNMPDDDFDILCILNVAADQNIIKNIANKIKIITNNDKQEQSIEHTLDNNQKRNASKKSIHINSNNTKTINPTVNKKEINHFAKTHYNILCRIPIYYN